MRSGALRHRIRIERPEQTQDARGERVTTWRTVATVRGDLRQLRGTERSEAAQITAAGTWRLKLRHVPGLRIDTTHRVVELATGRVLAIVAIIDPTGRDRHVEIELAEHTPAGVGEGPRR